MPDSFLVQQRLTAWARERTAKGGAPITIRIVKGANMEMERIDAALHDWPQAPYRTKAETDANYKQMLHYGLKPEHLDAVRIGIASHNLFDVAYGLTLAAAAEAGDRVQFEMLEGMANHQRRALLEQTERLLLYAPACRKEEFLNAIGYLIRRLDENTGAENFLGHAFRLQVGSEDWDKLEAGFRAAFATRIANEPRRTQDRNTETFAAPRVERWWKDFENEPDTDWSLPQNGAWAEAITAGAKQYAGDAATPGFVVPAVVAGGELRDLKQIPCVDPSRPGAAVTSYAQAGSAEVSAALACAKADPDGWRVRTVDERSEVLGRVAVELRKRRGILMRAALLNGGKLLTESDPEVSEAIDFVEFYRATARRWFGLEAVAAKPCGTVVVVPPWNFPIAIPCGGIAAALAAGNTVILKPASDTVLIAWELCQAFWAGGVSRKTLQFVPCPGPGPGSELVSHDDANAVILTGGTETALRMLALKPTMRLSR
ncbi:MAG: proline dehydrogenase family protein [Pirellulales bacterium]